MGNIRVYNRTGRAITLKDYYVCDLAQNSGYYGAIEYLIPAGGSTLLSSSIFLRKLIEEMRPQQIRVQIEQEIMPLILNHEHFENNNAIVFEIGDNGALRVNFQIRRPGQTTFARWIWGLLRLSRAGPGADIEAAPA